MNQVLFDSWNPRLKRGEGSHSVFQPYSFVKDSSGAVPGSPELYEVRRELIFTVLTQYAYGGITPLDRRRTLTKLYFAW